MATFCALFDYQAAKSEGLKRQFTEEERDLYKKRGGDTFGTERVMSLLKGGSLGDNSNKQLQIENCSISKKDKLLVKNAADEKFFEGVMTIED